MFQSHCLRHVLEFSAAHILIENALLAPSWKMPSIKRIGPSPVRPVPSLVARRVNADIHHEQISQSIIVEVKKNGARRMKWLFHRKSCFVGNILELPAALVFKEVISHPHCRDEQVR